MKWTEGVEYKESSSGYYVKGSHSYKSDIRGFEYTSPGKKPTMSIDLDGLMTLYDGFWWNGSNLSIDADTNIRASAFHDAFYWCLDMDIIKYTWNNRRKADKVMYNIMREDGASWIRCRYFWRGLRTFGWLAC